MRKSSRRRRCGFTLIEVLLVLVILVALASTAVIAYGPMNRRAKKQRAELQVNALADLLKMYHLAMRSYPPNDVGLQALRSPNGLANPQRWDGPYADSEIPPDPWDQEYQYEMTARSFRVWSNGPDGSPGTEDDIGYWGEEE